MNNLWLFFAFIIIALLSWAITGWVYGHALKNAILDHPNHRSLHSEPTPHGGGLSIAILILSSIGLLWQMNYVSGAFALAALSGGGLVAVIGWIDDRFNFSTLARGFFYLLASAWAVYCLIGVNNIFTLDKVILFIGAILGVAWLTNLYNFMDGSDGIAALQATATGIMATILLTDARAPGLAWLSLIIVAASTGFMIWNWPPARIFMGDVGSCLLGFIYALIAIHSAVEGILPLSVWLILLSIFICDASLTLIKRFVSGEQWYRAHRQHAYQRFVQLGKSHAQLNYHVLIITMLMVYPMACLAYLSSQYQWWATVTVYVLLAGIWFFIQIKYAKSSQGKT